MAAEVDLDDILQRLLSVRSPQGKLTYVELGPQECLYVAERGRAIFQREPILVELEPPLTICGDIHGQYRDLLRILRADKMPPRKNYLFLGDYVDRGQQSLEVLMLLFILKIKYPEHVLLLRGNHESVKVNSIYGFQTECVTRATMDVFRKFNEAFTYLPLAAIVGQKMFCCHGGIPKGLLHLNQIRKIRRPIEHIPDDGFECDLTWADPSEIDGWTHNSRGISWCFGETPLNEFLEKFNFEILVRAHEVVRNGYEFFAERRCVTLFSAANYCNEFPNAMAIMHVDSTLLCTFSVMKPTKDPPGPDPFLDRTKHRRKSL